MHYSVVIAVEESAFSENCGYYISGSPYMTSLSISHFNSLSLNFEDT